MLIGAKRQVASELWLCARVGESSSSIVRVKTRPKHTRIRTHPLTRPLSHQAARRTMRSASPRLSHG